MDDSPLSRLSAELRNKISELVLVQGDHIALPGAFLGNDPTMTCRQMRRETSDMFWGSNEFHYWLTTFGIVTFDRFASTSITPPNIECGHQLGFHLTILGREVVSRIKQLVIPVP